MISVWKSVMYFAIFMIITIVNIEARPQNDLDSNQLDICKSTLPTLIEIALAICYNYDRVEVTKDMICEADSDPTFIKRIITEDETWAYELTRNPNIRQVNGVHQMSRDQKTVVFSQKKPLDTVVSDLEEIQNSYYDLPMPQQNVYSDIPLTRLQMLIARYNKPTFRPYLRSSSGGGVGELYRVPEAKRQVKYRQCYFNPITCFKK